MTYRSIEAIALAALALGTAGLVAAEHYPDVPAALRRKDRAVLQAVSRLANGYTDDVPLAEGECNCRELTCETGHFMLSCGGEMEPYNAGAITAARRLDRDTCRVCGCAWAAATLHASPVCIGF